MTSKLQHANLRVKLKFTFWITILNWLNITWTWKTSVFGNEGTPNIVGFPAFPQALPLSSSGRMCIGTLRKPYTEQAEGGEWDVIGGSEQRADDEFCIRARIVTSDPFALPVLAHVWSSFCRLRFICLAGNTRSPQLHHLTCMWCIRPVSYLWPSWPTDWERPVTWLHPKAIGPLTAALSTPTPSQRKVLAAMKEAFTRELPKPLKPEAGRNNI
jgi:hypothetical protein